MFYVNQKLKGSGVSPPPGGTPSLPLSSARGMEIHAHKYSVKDSTMVFVYVCRARSQAADVLLFLPFSTLQIIAKNFDIIPNPVYLSLDKRVVFLDLEVLFRFFAKQDLNQSLQNTVVNRQVKTYFQNQELSVFFSPILCYSSLGT